VVTSVPQDGQCLLLHSQAACLFFDCLTLDRRRAWAFKTWEATQTLTEHGIPEVLNLQQHRCENIKSNHKHNNTFHKPTISVTTSGTPHLIILLQPLITFLFLYFLMCCGWTPSFVMHTGLKHQGIMSCRRPTLLPHNKCRYAAAPQTISWKPQCQLGKWSVVTLQC